MAANDCVPGNIEVLCLGLFNEKSIPVLTRGIRGFYL